MENLLKIKYYLLGAVFFIAASDLVQSSGWIWGIPMLGPVFTGILMILFGTLVAIPWHPVRFGFAIGFAALGIASRIIKFIANWFIIANHGNTETWLNFTNIAYISLESAIIISLLVLSYRARKMD